MKELNIKIKRFDPSKDKEPYFQEYKVSFEDKEILSVMNVLEYIYQNLDHTLSFFYHAACKQAACGKCLVKVNGKNVLACKEKVVDNNLIIEPYNEKVVRDLVCR